MDKHKVLEQLLMELHHFLLILDKETLSGNATVHKGLLADLLQSYGTSNGADEEYIYMNKVVVGSKEKQEKDETADVPVNGKASKHSPVPQKSLPDLPPPRTDSVTREPFPLPAVKAPSCSEASESYYEEAQPYEETVNDDGEAVSSSYESYDEEEATTGGKSPWAQHRWPSAEASIELMKDARICGFLWRKKWLGQWAKQLCVIREHRLLCYKSSKEQTPLLDVSLLGCSVTYKEKQPKRKEHKLKIVPMGGEAVVLGLQSKEQTEQWLKVIQEISPKPGENGDSQHSVSDSPRLICTKGEVGERHSAASESGSSTDSHADAPEKDVKKKYSGGLKLSNLMNIGKKKATSLESAEKCVETSGYLNVLVNSQWRTCWCLIKNGHLCFYQDKNKSKVSQPAVKLEGCQIWPDPSPDHLYSFRIDMSGTQLATLEAKTSAVMGHWLGLLLSQTGSKTDPEELTYDYVNAERIASIVNAAKTSLYLMQRRYSEPNTYIDALPSSPHNPDELYDDVASITDPEDIVSGSLPQSEENDLETQNETSADDPNDPLAADEEESEERVYLDLVPVRSFLHTVSGGKETPLQETSGNPSEELKEPSSQDKEVSPNKPPEPDPATTLDDSSSAREEHANSKTPPPIQEPPKRTSTSSGLSKVLTLPTNTGFPVSPQPLRPKAFSTGCPGAVEGKLGKRRTEADLLRYSDERERLEREREEVRSRLARLKKERKETKEELNACQDARQQASLEARLKQMEDAGREAEQRRVEVELLLVEVKESLKKVEAGPFTLGTTVDGSHQDTPATKSVAPPSPQIASPPPSGPVSGGPAAAANPPSPVNSASALKNRPASIMATKGKVLQKAKEWERKSTT
ncbi:actin filament-associated protein 1-like 2 [Corythoichthys intestinalis]|uniref:actin filament-associated protein 1-like 2 n=1 Tax=Corythoichthys intestinalis TaxID=161448 RepID=UPI0025A61701|nr:actin filament-associated protein 1-like 2 [Corythoichthys intestinalis]XP_057682459.1 actin filament-associated protein 1-like 2 [Corythoichthys intestinalis]XP_057682461.1 actin filament-associated protein 1-like 2 [Corythoichthys intestinalis]